VNIGAGLYRLLVSAPELTPELTPAFHRREILPHWNARRHRPPHPAKPARHCRDCCANSRDWTQVLNPLHRRPHVGPRRLQSHEIAGAALVAAFIVAITPARFTEGNRKRTGAQLLI